ncbi:hypothetical protein GCM10018787_10100 [Streptomyces thermodiastaticus]|nr:hypothetical protein GCM10018787_10100 [Streptomyces thermodiastaticus]
MSDQISTRMLVLLFRSQGCGERMLPEDGEHPGEAAHSPVQWQPPVAVTVTGGPWERRHLGGRTACADAAAGTEGRPLTPPGGR